MGINNSKDKTKSQKVNNNTKIKISEKEKVKEYEIKICLLGDLNVGKSSISNRFCLNSFNKIGGAYGQKNIILNNDTKIKFHIFTASGNKELRSTTKIYFKDANAIILIYDVTNEKSLDSLNYWLKEINENVENDNILLCLAGNKCDAESNEKKVPSIKGKQFAEEHNMIFYETSAKTGEGIKELFQAIAEKEYNIMKGND